MRDKVLESVSTYFLLLELLNGGDTGLIRQSSPILEASILLELKRRSAVDYGSDKIAWARWFIGSDEQGTEIERSNLVIFIKTMESMERIWSKVADERSEP